MRSTDEIREIFSHYDYDKSGAIDPQEWGNLLSELDVGFTEEEARAGLKALDTNQNGKIDFDEFIRWWNER